MTKFALAVVCALAVTAAVSAQQPQSFYDLKTNALDGKPGNLAQYKGKVSLVVNVPASAAIPLSTQGLEKLQREMKGKSFNVLGFPSNDFGGQEPRIGGGDRHVLQADVRRDVSDVREASHEKGRRSVTDLCLPWDVGKLPAWNFSKYVIDKQGRIAAFFPSEVTPEDPALRAAIAKALAN
jgi:glutathione peroxidase